MLSPLGPVTTSPRPRGMAIPYGCVTSEDIVLVKDAYGNDVTRDATQEVKVVLHSESSEMFTDLHVWLVLSSGGGQVHVPMNSNLMAPKQVLPWTAYFTEGTLPEGPLDIKVWFTDAAGKRWERVTGKALRPRKKSEVLPSGKA